MTPSTTVKELRRSISKEAGLPLDRFVLQVGGRPLQDEDATMRDVELYEKRELLSILNATPWW